MNLLPLKTILCSVSMTSDKASPIRASALSDKFAFMGFGRIVYFMIISSSKGRKSCAILPKFLNKTCLRAKRYSKKQNDANYKLSFKTQIHIAQNSHIQFRNRLQLHSDIKLGKCNAKLSIHV